MRSPIQRRAYVALLSCVLCLACKEQPPEASSEELARAERIYTQCVEEELGLQLEELKLAPGEIWVRFAPGTSASDEARALQICEPRIAFVLEPGAPQLLGPPANLGRPASDEELTQLVRARAKLGFEGALLLETQGQRRLAQGSGRLKKEEARAPDLDTAFDCGSIMKQVTAALVFLLEQEGTLSRHQTLAELLPDVPARWRDVSLDLVLRHRAGLHEYHDSEGDFEPMTRDQALRAIVGQEPLFPPDTQTAYSNAGYTLLAIVLEEITGIDYRTLARERVFQPLAMQRTGFYHDPLWSDGNVAIGRAADEFLGNDPARWPEPSWALRGNGGLVSTLEDLLRFAHALDDDSLFQADTRAAFWAMHGAGEIDGRAFYAYAGGNDFGFQAVVAHVPEDQAYLVVASHVLSPVTAEILAIDLIQTAYGAIAGLPSQD